MANTSIQFPLGIDSSLGATRTEKDFGKYVDQLIKQVLFTSPGDRVNRPGFGCGLRQMIFAPNSEVTANLVQVTINQALDRWLSDYIKVEKVQVKAVHERLDVTISYVLVRKKERRILNMEVAI